MSGLVRLAFAVGGVVLFLTAGLGLSEFLTTLRKRPGAIRLAYSYLLGVAFVAGAMYVASFLFGLRLGRTVVVSIVLLPAGLGLIRRLSARHGVEGDSNRRSCSGKTARHDPFVAAVVAIAILVSLGVLVEAVINPVSDFDGRMTWCLQAKYVRADESVTPRALRESKWYVTNRGCPLLLPLAQVAVQQAFATPDDDRVIRLFYAAFFPASLLILYEGASRLAGPRSAATVVLMASIVPFLAFWGNGGAAGTYSDFPLACFFSAGILLLLTDRNSLSVAIVAGVLLAACVLTKREGLVLALIAVVFGGCVVLSRSTRRVPVRRVSYAIGWLGLLIVPVVSAVALRMSWSVGIPSTMEDYVTPLRKPSTYIEWFSRFMSVTPEMFSETFNPEKWSVFWAVVVVALIAGRRALRYRSCRLLLVEAVAPLAIGCLAYGIHPDPQWLARHSWSRFLGQSSLLSLVVVALCARQAIRGNGGNQREPAGRRNPGAAGTEAGR